MIRLPFAPLESLLMAVEEAVRLAQDGDPASGYEALITSRARALEGERNWESSVPLATLLPSSVGGVPGPGRAAARTG